MVMSTMGANQPDISDPTEWLNTPLSTFAPLDAAVRCQVCKDFYTTPMLTSCSHTFCSICIRRCLAADGKCPACRASEQEIKLRRNWAMDEVVTAFKSARPAALSFAREARDGLEKIEQHSRKRKLEQLSQEENSDQRRKTRSQSRRETSTQDSSQVTEVDDDVQEVSDGLVACPLCGRRMEEARVYLHLDTCEVERKRGANRAPGTADTRESRRSTSIPHRPTAQPQLERLPKLNYSLYNLTQLRKKLNELGIRSTGSKDQLQRRHTEFVNLWNSSCDSSKPRTRRELLHELDIWERSQGTLAPTSSGPGSTLMRKDFDGAAWAASHSDDFKKLIASARQRKGPPPTKQSDAEANGSIPKADSNERPEDQVPAEGQGESEGGRERSALPPEISRSVLSGDGVAPSAAEIDNGGLEVGDSDAEGGDTTPNAPQTAANIHHDQPPSTPTHAEAPQPSPIPSKFLSPAKPRMFQDVGDPIVDADAPMDVR